MFKFLATSSYRERNYSTSGIMYSADPALWKKHRFGLSQKRWDRLKGRVFWITGAGTGYGRAIALSLAAAGAHTFITGRRLVKLEETRAEGCELGIDVKSCIPLIADITSESDIARAINTISILRGHLSGLIHCAGLPQPEAGSYPLADLDLARWNMLMETNVTGQWLVSKAAVKLFHSADTIRILYLTSEAGWADTPGFGAYNISKSAVNAIGTSFAAECKLKYLERDVQINVISPGEARTEMNRDSSESPYSVVSMVLALMSHPKGGPNGHFFHRDGRHLSFGYSRAYTKDILSV